MTNQPNDGERPDILRKHDDSLSGALMGGIAVALLLIFGVAIFMLSGNRDIVATDPPPRVERTVPQPPPSTIGQGSGTEVMPGRDQNVPNPTRPAPPGSGSR